MKQNPKTIHLLNKSHIFKGKKPMTKVCKHTTMYVVCERSRKDIRAIIASNPDTALKT